ncbi:bifunctional dTDP-4-dehydrorhamnose 3,5-epimerase family protein/NAD(P)-dependent oxidoreductase [Agromyces sp. C10]|nr:bifunctional dTDP-4-dehydrorhamnose 3,5-epimerase family protein/NAD(P)-dependent oxidoreductase [Agromyces sp. C10]
MWDLPVRGDRRGWFKENWQREKMSSAGLPDFGPVQNNVSFNRSKGTTRGIHAEPWDKLVSVAAGRVFGAWVDLREGATFGAVFTAELDPSTAVFVPRGVGNAFQTLEPDTVYSYLVNDHWSPDAQYTFLNLADETVNIAWPIPLGQAELSSKDMAHPRLNEVRRIPAKKTLVIGADGQLGRALQAEYANDASVEFADRSALDLTRADLDGARNWRDYETIVNAAAYTAVDAAMTSAGRTRAWAVNVAGVSRLAAIAAANDITMIHVSSDYVFDGAAAVPYTEEDSVSPLGVYGQTKAAGDAVAATVPKHYIVRTSWVIGDGKNFVRTMANLAERGVAPRVVDDQVGRLTFAKELARGIRHLAETRPPYGIYNLTGSGEPMSWADIARQVYALTGHDPARVTPVSTAEYFEGMEEPIAPRPRWSVLDLTRIESSGFQPKDHLTQLAEYLSVAHGSSASTASVAR